MTLYRLGVEDEMLLCATNIVVCFVQINLGILDSCGLS